MANNFVLSAVLELKNKFTSAIEGARRSAIGFERTFRNTASIVQSSAIKINSGLDKIGGVINKISGKIVKLGAIGAAGVGGLGAYAIKGAADMEKYRNVLETVLKDEKQAAETMTWANKFANVTPFQNAEVIEGVVKLRAYGLDKESIQYIGDMASAMGKPLMQAVEAIADAQTGELERLKEFGLTKDVIAEYSKKVGDGDLINAKGQITDLKAFNIVLKDLINQKFGGAMEKQANTFYGAMSTSIGTMKSAITQIAGIGLDGKVITGSMFDYIQQKAVGLANHLVKMQEDGTIDRWTKRIGSAFEQMIPQIESAWKSFKDNWSKEDVENIISGIGSIIKGFSDTITGCRNLVNNFSEDGIGAFRKFADDLPPVLSKAVKGIALATTAIIGLRAAAGDPIAIAQLAVIGGGVVGAGIGNFLGKTWADFEKWKDGYDIPIVETNFETYQKDKATLEKWQKDGMDPIAKYSGVTTADILSKKYGVEMPDVIGSYENKINQNIEKNLIFSPIKKTFDDMSLNYNKEKLKSQEKKESIETTTNLDKSFKYSPVININGSNLSPEEVSKIVQKELNLGAEGLYLKFLGGM